MTSTNAVTTKVISTCSRTLVEIVLMLIVSACVAVRSLVNA